MFIDTAQASEVAANELLADIVDLFENSSIGLQIVTREGIVKRANRTQRRLAGAPVDDPEAYGGTSLPDLIQEGEWDAIITALEQNGSVNNFHAKLRESNDVTDTWVIDAAAGTDDDADLIWWATRPLLTARLPGANDGSDSATWEAAWRETDVTPFIDGLSLLEQFALVQELDHFFEFLPVAIHEVGSLGTYIRANRFQLEICGCEDGPKAFIGQLATKLYGNESEISEMLAALVDKNPITNYPTTMVRRDGSLTPVVVHSRAVSRKLFKTRCFVFPAAEIAAA